MNKVIGQDEEGYYTDEGYVAIEDLTDQQLQWMHNEWFDMVNVHVSANYTLENNPLYKLLSAERELAMRENK